MLTKTIWDSLDRATGHARGLRVRRLLPQSAFNVFAALDKSTGHRFLLLKSSRSDVRPSQPLPSGRGFNTQFVATPSDPDGISCLRFELTERAHTDIFDVVGNDVLSNILQTTNEKAAFDAFVTRIVAWQRFLDELPAGGLSEQSQQGLFAELWFLREVMLPEIGPAGSVRAWAGPKQLAKDFQLTGVAFEVKASSAKQHAKFTISSELQLDTQGVKRLVLYCLLLERLVAGGTSLSELVQLVRADLQADTPTVTLFSELLLQVGYTDSDAARYTSRFAVRSQHFFEVKGDFPRIVGADLRVGVGDVHYSIMQSECEHYSLPESDARNLIKAAIP